MNLRKRVQFNLFRTKSWRIITAFALLLLIVAIPLIIISLNNAQKTEAVWFDDNYAYRQSVAITGGSSSVTDYQIYFSLDTATLISANKMQSDCDDLRVTDSNGKLLPIWIDPQFSCNNSSTKIWVKANSIPTEGSTFYIYYGNPQVEGISNRKMVMVADDDFSINSIAQKWTSTLGTWSYIQGPPPYVTLNSGAGDWSAFTHKPLSPNDVTITIKTNTGPGTTGMDQGIAYRITGNDYYTCEVYHKSDAHGMQLNEYISSTRVTNATTSYTPSNNIDVNIVLKIVGTSITCEMRQYSDNSLLATVTVTDSSLTSGKSGLMANRTAAFSNTDHPIYDYYVRKAITTEPSAGSPSSETKAPSPIAYWKFDEGTGTTAQDSSPNNHDANFGTSNGTATKIDDASNFGALLGAGREIVRSSNGTIYTFLNKAGTCEVWKSTDGSSWTKPTAGVTCTTAQAVGLAIDGSDNLHLIYANGTRTIRYRLYTTSNDSFSSEESVSNCTGAGNTCSLYDIAVDSNSIPHIAYGQYTNSSGDVNVKYTNRISGSWKAVITSSTLSAVQTSVSMLIDNNNIPQIVTTIEGGGTVLAFIGNTNDTTTLTSSGDLDATINATAGQQAASIAVDSSNNTWITYVDGTTNYIRLIKHNSGDGWTTWQSSITNSNAGYEPSLAIDGTNVYVLYQDSSDNDIKYLKYNGSWTGPTTLHTGTYQDVHAKWSYSYNNKGNVQIDYLYSDATDVYWASLSLFPAASPSWQADNQCISSKCLYFDGTNDGLIASVGPPTFNSSFTISTWIRSGGNSATKMIWEGNSTSAPSLEGGDSAGYDFYIGNTYSLNTGAITAGQWYFISATFDSSNGHMDLYVNGKLKASRTDATADTISNLYIGARSDGSLFWKGFIDDFKVYNYARSAAQIQTDYNARGNNQGSAGNLSAGNSPEALSNGLVGYWNMDESSWTVDCSTSSVLDSSGLGNNGSACPNSTGPAGGDGGKFAKSGSFDGSNDYINIPHSSSVSPNNQITVSAWIKTSSGSNRYIVTKHNDSFYLGIGVVNANKFEFYINGVNSPAWVSSTTSVTDNAWHLVTATYDGTTQSVYVDGKLEASIAQSGSIQTGTASVMIGARKTSPGEVIEGNTFSGNIDEVRLYDRALSGNDIQTLYNWVPGPVGEWKFDEGTGTTVKDATTGGQSGSLNGNTRFGSGKFGKGLIFDGTNDSVTIPDSSLHDFNSGLDFSYSFWVKRNGSTAHEYLLAKGADNSNATGYSIFLSSGVTPQIWIGNSSGARTSVTSSTSISDNNWHHIAAVYDRDGNGMIYLDGVLTGSGSISSLNIDQSTTDPLSIGCYVDDLGNHSSCFTGSMDEVKLFRYTLTQKQVIEDMNASHPAPGSPVGSALGHWKFDEGYGTTAQSSGNQSINATLNNMSSPATSTSGWNNAGKFGRGVQFDGTDDNVRFTEVSAIDLGTTTDNYTLTAWVKTSTNFSTDAHIISKDNGSGAYPYRLYMNSSEYACFSMSDGTNSPSVCGSTALNDGEWHYIAGIRDVATDKLYIYVDGKQINSATDSTTATAENSDNFTIGNGGTSYTSQDFTGTIDEPKIYSGALSSDQIMFDMNRGSTEVLGATSTNSAGTSASNSNDRSYCIPGDTSTCRVPVLYWDFEEGGSTSAYDKSGNGLTGTLSTPQRVPGKLGKGLDFNGTSDVVTIADNTLLEPSTDMTITTWVYFRSLPSTRAEEATFAYKTHSSSPWYSYHFYAETDDDLCFGWINTSNSGSDTCSTGGVGFAANRWHQVSAVKSGATVYLYVDGREVPSYASQPAYSGTIKNSNSALNIGGVDATQKRILGRMDDFRLYDYGLTSAQIAWNYNNGKPVAQWKMDECQGTTINDSAGNSLTGTLSGATPGTCATSGSWFNGVTGRRNYSLDFDGTDDVVTITNANPIDFDSSLSNGVSFCAWVNADSDGENDVGQILFKGTNTYLRVDSQSGGNLDVETSLDLGTTDATVNVTSGIATSSWNHICTSYTDDGDDEVEIYINGNLRGTSTNGVGSPATSDSNNLLIGGTTTANYDGKIDDVRIYNYGLNATQIKSVYSDGAINFSPASGAP